MKNSIVIALDAMGGDCAPDIVVEGASLAAKRHKNISFVIYGDRKKVQPLVDKYKNLFHVAKVVHTDKTIGPEDKPSSALRKGRDSSMGLAFQMVKNKQAHCAVSAGNTGALMALAMLIVRPLKGVRRPAICASFPTQKGWCCMLDLGANLEANTENLIQFGVMGSVFYRILSGCKKPKVGLLNVGVEEMKGHSEIKEAGKILSKMPNLNYVGFVEGNDIPKDKANVIVSDGFSGNVALKTIEGTAKFVIHIIKKALLKSFFGVGALLVGIPVLIRLRKRLDPANYNGAIMLGLNGIIIKCHGGSTAKAFSVAIRLAIDLAERDFTKQLKEEFSNINF